MTAKMLDERELVKGRMVELPASEAAAIDAVVAAQKAAGDAIDPNGARRIIRALTALGLLKFE